MWESAQAQFAAALLEPTRTRPAAVVSEKGDAAERFDVYRNSVVSGLVRALAVRFLATERLVGEEFFAAMAREFVVRRPPTSPALLEYGADFADFVARFEPAADLPYLADVVRLEDARVRAYHAADVEPLSPQSLASVSPEVLSQLIFDIHPSATVLRSEHPVMTIWTMNVGDAEAGSLDRWEAEDVLVTRPHLRVETRRLAAGGAIFLRRLAAGAPLGEAVRDASAKEPAFDLSAILAETLAAGFLSAFRGDT